VLPGAFLGFFAAVLFGAVLSSFNSLLNSSSTLFGVDLFRQFFDKNASELKTVKAGKMFGILLAILSMVIAPFIANAPDGLFSYIQESLGSLSVPILAVVAVGMATKKVPALAAKIVLTLGVLMYLVSQFILAPYFIETALTDKSISTFFTYYGDFICYQHMYYATLRKTLPKQKNILTKSYRSN
jgi:SSS family solute:Na+ symporter